MIINKNSLNSDICNVVLIITNGRLNFLVLHAARFLTNMFLHKLMFPVRKATSH